MEVAVFGAGLFIFLAHLLDYFFERTRVPDILLLMLLGVLVGPIFGWMSPADFGAVGEFLAVVTLVVILCASGLSLKFQVLLKAAKRATPFALFSMLGAVALIGLCLNVFLGLDSGMSRLGGFILGGRSPAVVIPVVKGLRATDETTTLLTVESALTDVLCIIATVGIATSLQSEDGLQAVPDDAREGVSNPAPPADAYLEYLAQIYADHPSAKGETPELDDPKFKRFVAVQPTWDRAMAERRAAVRWGGGGSGGRGAWGWPFKSAVLFGIFPVVSMLALPARSLLPRVRTRSDRLALPAAVLAWALSFNATLAGTPSPARARSPERSAAVTSIRASSTPEAALAEPFILTVRPRPAAVRSIRSAWSGDSAFFNGPTLPCNVSAMSLKAARSFRFKGSEGEAASASREVSMILVVSPLTPSR